MRDFLPDVLEDAVIVIVVVVFSVTAFLLATYILDTSLSSKFQEKDMHGQDRN